MSRVGVLQSADTWFPGTVSTAGGDWVKGDSQGVPVILSFTNYGSDSCPDPYTEVQAQAQVQGITLELRRQTPQESQLEAEKLVRDLRTGDSQFDQAYVIEGAPSDIILQWLDADIRGRLVALKAPGIAVDRQALCCKVPGWIFDAGVLRRLVEVTALLAARLPSAIQRANAASGGEAYRGGQAMESVERNRAADIADLQATKGRRQTRESTQSVKIMVGVIAGIVIMVLSWFLIPVVIGLIAYAFSKH